MLSDEEKHAIEELKNKKADYFMISNLTGKILLKVIEKQQKEIEELKDKYSDEKIRNTVIKRYNEVIEKDYVSKDKIKAKIEDYKKEQEFYDKNEDREWGQFNNWDWIDRIINEMQSLLKEE